MIAKSTLLANNSSYIIRTGRIYFSFSDMLTYRHAGSIREQKAVAYLPLDRILVETDLPFIVLVDAHGKNGDNESAFTRY